MNRENPLGKEVVYNAVYDPELLYPVPRAFNREMIGVGEKLPFSGVDIWNAYEISWLNRSGKPMAAMAEIRFSAKTVNIVESKSLKLYLNSFNQTAFSTRDEVEAVIRGDLAKVAEGEADVSLILPADFPGCRMAEPVGTLIDDLDLETDVYTRNPDFLTTGQTRVEECLYSNLLRSNCPVTGQPDWATVLIDYRGPEIDRTGLLAYIVSFREHTGFHENCVEQIFQDITARCKPECLGVYARFTRRGGIDINPFRSTPGCYAVPDNTRFARQ